MNPASLRGFSSRDVTDSTGSQPIAGTNPLVTDLSGIYNLDMNSSDLEDFLASNWSSAMVPPLARPGEDDPFGELGLQIFRVSATLPATGPTWTGTLVANLEILAEGVSTSGVPPVGETSNGVEIIDVGLTDFESQPVATSVTVLIHRTCHCEVSTGTLASASIGW